MRRLQHSLHINYIIIWWWFLGTWSPISWYLSGYLRPLHMLAWAYRLLFFYWHWSFIARMRFHEANTNTLNHKNTEPNRCGVNESSTVEGKKKLWCVASKNNNQIEKKKIRGKNKHSNGESKAKCRVWKKYLRSWYVERLDGNSENRSRISICKIDWHK